MTEHEAPSGRARDAAEAARKDLYAERNLMRDALQEVSTILHHPDILSANGGSAVRDVDTAMNVAARIANEALLRLTQESVEGAGAAIDGARTREATRPNSAQARRRCPYCGAKGAWHDLVEPFIEHYPDCRRAG